MAGPRMRILQPADRPSTIALAPALHANTVTYVVVLSVCLSICLLACALHTIQRFQGLSGQLQRVAVLDVISRIGICVCSCLVPASCAVNTGIFAAVHMPVSGVSFLKCTGLVCQSLIERQHSSFSHESMYDADQYLAVAKNVPVSR